MNTIAKTKILLLKRGLKPADVAAGTGLDLGYVYNLLSGRVAARAGRKKIETFLGVNLWPKSETDKPRSRHMSEETNPRFSLRTTPAAGQAPKAVDPAAANENIEWVDLVGKVGLTVVAVQAYYSPSLWQNSGFEEDLGRELSEAHLGEYDSVRYFNPMVFFFLLRTQDLAAGLQLIKARLAAIGLLPMVKIGIADQESKIYRVFYSERGQAAT